MANPVVKTLDATSFAATKENFPALQNFFEMTESNSNTAKLVDDVGGVTTGNATVTSADGTKLTTSQATANNAISAGTLVPPAAKVAILFAVGNLNGGVLNIGLPSGQGGSGSLQMLPISGKYQVDDGTTTNSITATFGASVEAHALILEPAVKLSAFRLQSNGTYGANGTPLTTGVVTVSALNQSTAFGNALAGNIKDVSGAAIFYFAAVPTDIEAAMRWMYQRWLAGKKEIWPAWKDKV